MKKAVPYVLIIMLLAVLLSSCSIKPAEEKNNSPFFVNHNSDHVFDGSILYFVRPLEHSEGKTTHINGYLFCALDVSAGGSLPLCGKPECLHNDANCNAYIGTNNIRLMLYKGRLYWLEGSYSNTTLYSMNTDGTGKKEEMQVDPELFKLAYGMGSAEIADDTLYICGTAENVNNGAVVRSAVVFRQSLGAGKAESIFREDIPAEVFGRIMDGKLYFAVSEEFSEDEEEEEEPLETRLFSYSIKTGELEELYSHSEPGTAYRYITADNGKVCLFGYANGLVYSCENGGVTTLGTEGQTSIDVGDGCCMCWQTGGKYTVRDPQENELYSGVFPPENDPSFPDALWGRAFIGSSGKKLFYQITFIGQDAPTITQIVEFDTEAHSVKALFDSRNNG